MYVRILGPPIIRHFATIPCSTAWSARCPISGIPQTPYSTHNQSTYVTMACGQSGTQDECPSMYICMLSILGYVMEGFYCTYKVCDTW